MDNNISYYLKQFQEEIGLIQPDNREISFNQYSDEFSFDSNVFSWPYDFQRPISDENKPTLSQLLITPKTSLNSASQETAHLNHKNLENQMFSQVEYFDSSQSDDVLSLLNLNTEWLNQPPKSRIKDQIKTFPNFIFRTFTRRLKDYQHLYSKNDGLQCLKEYLKDNQGHKYYTLEQLNKLFKDQTQWNCRLNRAIFYQMLNRHNYTDTLQCSQRKKKKTYLIMTKVFKLRCRNALLCSRVQCE